jgi:hypothetical protein
LRHLLYWLLLLQQSVPIMPVWILFVVTRRLRPSRFSAGIRVFDVSPDKASSERFFAAVVGALQLLQRADVRRFHRVQKEIKTVLRVSLRSRARYQRLGRACLIDTRHYSRDGSESFVVHVACTLVHEATHGRLFTMQLPYAGEAALRHEEICQTEVQRFLRKLSYQHVPAMSRLSDDVQGFRSQKWNGTRQPKH